MDIENLKEILAIEMGFEKIKRDFETSNTTEKG